ncbi:MAG: MFS transporter [Candidatus Nanopelagicales bacterium]|nr:MFS transporter [Actinomycetota bacterium]HNL51533.1 MFS transporter [Actinomycetota bacterium]HNO15699.1 MFS transporter [Actinomycetota bacterium]HUM86858.1 MFS transporter [Actinomycetota bacterium]
MSDTKEQGRGRLPLPVLPLSLTYLAVALNMTIASVALPTISTELSATADQLAWIVNATPMTSAAFILFAGAWSDRLGRKRMLLLGNVIFLVAALLSGMTNSVEILILLRALTGLGSALAMPSAMALTFDVTAGTSQRTAVGIMGGTQAIGALLGPLVGGAALVTFGWHAAFWSVAPMLALALIMNVIWLPKDTPAERRSMDNGGATLTAVAGVAFLYAAVSAASSPDVWVWVALVVGVLSSIALVWWERRVDEPLFDPAIVKRRTFLIPTLTVFLVQFTLGGLLFLNTQYVQLVLGFSALAAGLFLMPALLMWTASSATAGVTAKRFGARNVTAIALVITGIGLVLTSSGGRNPFYPVLILGLVLTGVMGVAPALMTHTSVSNYPEERRSVGSAINSMAVRFGLAFGVAAYGTLLAIRYKSDVSGATQGLSPEDQYDATESLGGALNVAERTNAGGLADAARDAYVSGFQMTLIVAAVVLVVLAVIVWRGLPARLESGSTDNPEVAA